MCRGRRSRLAPHEATRGHQLASALHGVQVEWQMPFASSATQCHAATGWCPLHTCSRLCCPHYRPTAQPTNHCLPANRNRQPQPPTATGPQVVAGICPFNFPAMVPLWMFPMAVTAGNTFVLKPSERDPGAAMMLADLAQQAGLPK